MAEVSGVHQHQPRPRGLRGTAHPGTGRTLPEPPRTPYFLVLRMELPWGWFKWGLSSPLPHLPFYWPCHSPCPPPKKPQLCICLRLFEQELFYQPSPFFGSIIQNRAERKTEREKQTERKKRRQRHTEKVPWEQSEETPSLSLT